MTDEPVDDQHETAGELAGPVATRERAVAIASMISASATAALLVWHGPWDDPAWWMTAPFVVVWCCVPYAWVGRSLRAGRNHEAGARLSTFGAGIVIALAAWVLWHYHFTPGERGGRVFLMLPIWQGLGFAPFALLVRWLRPVRAQGKVEAVQNRPGPTDDRGEAP